MRQFVFVTLFMLFTLGLSAQFSFTNRNDLLSPQNHYSGVAIAVLDVNADGLDDVVRMNAGSFLAICHQTAPNQTFDYQAIQSIATDSQWGMCAADVDNNGFVDILAGGFYDNIKIAMANDDGTAYTIVQITQPTTFVQGVNFADINNDGWLDAFVCHDDQVARVFSNDGSGNFAYAPTWMDLTTIPVSDNSGNYGSVWSDIDNDGDLDLYIAKCRQGINNPADGRRINQLFINNGDGTYTQDVTNDHGLRIGAQSWTADFGDIDNDGDFDCFVTNHDVKSMLLENDGTGHFTDISLASGIQAISGLPIQGVFRDFDNDGYIDVIVAGSEQFLLHNNGDKTFSLVSGVFNTNTMESFAIGDLNNDGFQDVYAGYGNIYTDPSNIPDVLWMNDGNDNHFFGLNLRGIQSNANGVGAKVHMYSALGTQVREVRSGESYGIQNSMKIHFGLGNLTEIDSVRVVWPSGIVDVLYNPDADQYITLFEGGCQAPNVTVQALGATTFCSGDSLEIVGPDGYSYLWSTGETTQNVIALSQGNYQLTVTTADGCTAVSAPLSVTVDPIEIPTIQVAGDTLFCSGGSVVLSCSDAQSYLWSNGATTQSIEVTESGQYTVQAQGQCSFFSSETLGVNVVTAPALSVASDTIPIGGSAVLKAVGADSILWYDVPSGGMAVASGDSLLTGPITASQTYWVGSILVADEPNGFVGPTDHQGTPFSGSQYNGDIIFDVFTPVKLASVKVYASVAGVRKIDLVNNAGQTVQSVTVDIPLGTSNQLLDLDLPVGTNWKLTTDQSVNLVNFGSNSPQMRRSDQGVQYPYEIPNVLSLKNATLGSDRFYYFYNWEINFPGVVCESTLQPVTAFVDSALVAVCSCDGPVSIEVYPNPTNGKVTLNMSSYTDFEGGEALFSVNTLNGQVLRTETQYFSAQANQSKEVSLAGLPSGIYILEWRFERGVVRKKVVLY